MKKWIASLILACLLAAYFVPFACAEGRAPSAEQTETEKLSFDTKDWEGNDCTLADFSDAKVILVNYWEPWCPPCVREMPDLEKLYEKYKEQGLVILGIFGTEGMDKEVRTVLESCSITYPILRMDEGLGMYAEQYVPSTIFVAPDGAVLSERTYIGAKSLETWESIILEYLNLE